MRATATAITTRTINKVLLIGHRKAYDDRQHPVFVHVEYDANGELHLSGVEGPRPGGNCWGSCGQIDISAPGLVTDSNLTADQVNRLAKVWDAWHLNHIRAGCAHQRANWDPSAPLEVVSYKLTAEARKVRETAQEKAAAAAIVGQIASLTDTERALLAVVWHADTHTPPDADSPLSGCYEVSKRETKTAGWVYPKEHPRGLLMKPCEVCGHKYGSTWLKEDVPAEVLAFLESLPESPVTPAWI